MYSKGLSLFSFAVSRIEYITELPLAPLGLTENSQFLRPITNGLMLRSARLFDSSKRPSRYTFSR